MYTVLNGDKIYVNPALIPAYNLMQGLGKINANSSHKIEVTRSM